MFGPVAIRSLRCHSARNEDGKDGLQEFDRIYHFNGGPETTNAADPQAPATESGEGNTMSNYSKYQQNIIKKYYENRDAIALQRVQELVTELYLTEGKKRERHWKTVASHLEKLGVRQAHIDHLVEQDNPELVANLIQSLMSEIK